MKMTQLLILFGFITFQASALPKSVFEKASCRSLDTSQRIKLIKMQFDRFNSNIKKYEILEKDLMDESTEGGSITGYYDGQAIKKIIVHNYGETGKFIIEYYFDQGELYFVHSKLYHGGPYYLKDGKTISINENRYYFYQKGIIKWLNGNKIISPTIIETKKQAVTILTDSEKNKKQIGNCNNFLKRAIGDTVRCKYGSDCASTGYVLSNTRDSCGHVIHVNPKNKNVPLEKYDQR